MLRFAHVSDLHVGHLSANLIRLGRLVLPRSRGEGAWDIATRLLASSWFERRSLFEPLLRSTHLAHDYQTKNLVAVVQSAREHGCQHVILTGDIANLGAASEMREARLVLSAFGYEGDSLTVVPGNHDVINFQGVAEFRSVMAQPPWPHLRWLAPDVVALALDSTVHRPDLDWRDAIGMNARGTFSDDMVAKADELLSTVPKDAFKILCCHHHLVDLPPDGYVDDWSGKLDPRLAGPAEHASDILDLAEKYAVGLILFGHRHRATHHLFTIRGIPAACSGSVTEVQRQGNLRYRVFDLEGGRIRRRYWVDTYPENASREVVEKALRGISSVETDDSLKLTIPLREGQARYDIARLQEKRRALDEKVLEKVRKRLLSEQKR
jgi:3',5'-cyclic AMP phosphodiesterase CpdA